jgi:putative ABC transport system permease protein
VLLGAIAAARAARAYDVVVLKILGATRAQVVAMLTIEYGVMAAIVALVALALGVGGGWFIVTRVFTFDWLPDWPVILTTLATGAALTIVIGVLATLPVLRARPATALRAL